MKHKPSTLKIYAHATGEAWLYYDRGASEKIRKFMDSHDGQDVDIIYEAHDGVQYFQHKYYRGYVLTAIAEAQGEKDVDYLHEFVLKQEFLKIPVNDWRDIPPRHRKGARVIMDGEKVVAYVSSTACLNYEEMKAYILRCEDIRDGLTDWSYKDPREAERTRALAFKERVVV